MRLWNLCGNNFDVVDIIPLLNKTLVYPISDAKFDELEVAEALCRISQIYFEAFELLTSKQYLDKAIDISVDVLTFLPDEYIGTRSYIRHLCFALYRRYWLEGNLDALNQAIRNSGLPSGVGSERDQAQDAYYLGIMLASRYECQYSFNDALESMHLAETIVKQYPQDPKFVNGLVVALLGQFKRKGSLADLERGILEAERLLELRLVEPRTAASHKDTFANCLLLKVEETGCKTGLKKARELVGSALRTTPGEGVYMPSCLTTSAFCSWITYEYTLILDDLTRSYQILKKVMDKTIDTSPDFRSRMRKFGVVVLLKYDHSSCEDCLNEALRVLYKALSLSQEKDNEKGWAEYAYALSDAHRKRFDKLHLAEDLENAIKYSNLAFHCNSRDWQATKFHLLKGLVLLSQHYVTPSAETLEEAINCFHSSVELAKDRGKPVQAWAYHNLSLALRLKYELGKCHQDLEKSIEWGTKAYDTMPDCHINNSTIAHNLSKSLYLLFKSPSGTQQDLLRSVTTAATALRMTPPYHILLDEHKNTSETLLDAAHEIEVQGLYIAACRVTSKSKFTL
jgi:tetratricopeptide (TPR) repeat protein